jgi:hypothetical protein
LQIDHGHCARRTRCTWHIWHCGRSKTSRSKNVCGHQCLPTAQRIKRLTETGAVCQRRDLSAGTFGRNLYLLFPCPGQSPVAAAHDGRPPWIPTGPCKSRGSISQHGHMRARKGRKLEQFEGAIRRARGPRGGEGDRDVSDAERRASW